MPAPRPNRKAAARKKRLADTIAALTALQFGPKQRTETAAYTLLALLDLQPEATWADAQAPLRGITPIIDFIATAYGNRYAPNTRGTIPDVQHPDLPADIPADYPLAIPPLKNSAPALCYCASLTEHLAPLMHYRDTRPAGNGLSKFNFADILKSKEYVEFGPEHESLSISQYRRLVEQKVNELTASNPILQKIRDAQPVTEEEAEILATQLHDEHPHITLQLLRRVYHHQKAPYIRFIRHILGLEVLESFPDTVSRSIDQFITAHPALTSHQLQFLSLLREFLIERGGVEKRDLIQSPFTIIHPSGIRGVFSPSEINEILALTDRLAS